MWIKLENFKCPACPSSGGTDWKCKKDGRSVWLNEFGIMECTPGTHKGKVIKWKWNCGSSFHDGEFLSADLEGFTFALSQAVQLTGKAGSDWNYRESGSVLLASRTVSIGDGIFSFTI